MYFPAKGKLYEDGDTSNVIVDGGFYTFTKTFKYLGSIICWNLKADADIAARIRSATGVYGKLRKLLKSRRVCLRKRSAIYVVTVLTILLFGSESWACREDLLQKLEVFHNQCVRDMCQVTRHMQWKRRIRTKTLLRRTKLPTIREMVASRQLRWVGKVARMDDSRTPKQLMTAWVNAQRPRGRPEQTFGHSLKKFLNLRAKLNAHAWHLHFDLTAKDGSSRTISATELSKALKRTNGRYGPGVLTWVHITSYPRLWQKVVTNNYKDRATNNATLNPYENIHANLPHPHCSPRNRTRNRTPRTQTAGPI